MKFEIKVESFNSIHYSSGSDEKKEIKGDSVLISLKDNKGDYYSCGILCQHPINMTKVAYMMESAINELLYKTELK